MVLVLLANAVYSAVFFVCGHLARQVQELQAVEKDAAVIIYSHGTLSAAGAYKRSPSACLFLPGRRGMDGQKQWIYIRILYRTRVGDPLRFSGICYHDNQVPALI